MLASLIAAFASGESMLAVQRAKRAAVAYALAGILLLGALIFLSVALYQLAARRFGPIEAALGFAGGLFVIAMLILLVHRLVARSRLRRQTDRRKADLTAIGVTAALAVLPALLRGRVGAGALVAPAIAAIAYAIYRENRPKGPPTPGE